ncbi:MAG: hypothetical protein ACYDBV_11175 [Nitrospiria bacterium]
MICLVWDYGWFAPLAEKLAEDFDTVYYICNVRSGYPKTREKLVGEGINGVTRIDPDDFWEVWEEVDLFVFPDCYDGKFQQWLKDQGCLVWGTGISSWLEKDRMACAAWQKKVGLPLARTESIIGLDKLRETVKPNQFIKINENRGDFETVKNIDKIRSEQRFDEIAVELGAYKNLMEFILVNKIDGVETGYDGFSVDGKHPNKSLFGYEIKDCGYVGKYVDYKNLPPAVLTVNEQLFKVFEDEKMRGAFSNEIRVTDKRVPYLIDPTLRLPNPPYQIHLANIKNLGKMILEAARGNLVEPELEFKYGAIAIMNSEFAIKNMLPIKVPEKKKKWVKIMNWAIIDNEWYSVPLYGLAEFGAVVGLGNTLDEAIKACKENCEGIEADLLDIDIDSLDKAVKVIQEGLKYGIAF